MQCLGGAARAEERCWVECGFVDTPGTEALVKFDCTGLGLGLAGRSSSCTGIVKQKQNVLFLDFVFLFGACVGFSDSVGLGFGRGGALLRGFRDGVCCEASITPRRSTSVSKLSRASSIGVVEVCGPWLDLAE